MTQPIRGKNLSIEGEKALWEEAKEGKLSLWEKCHQRREGPYYQVNEETARPSK